MLTMVLASTVPTYAVLNYGTYSASKTMYHNCSYSRVEFDAYLSWPNVTNRVRWSGTSKTVWYGANPYNADSIKHTNTVSVSGIGSLSFSNSGAGAAISGSTMTDEMTITNYWKVVSNFDYSLKKGVFITNTNFSSSGRVQIGTNFYSMSCTT